MRFKKSFRLQFALIFVAMMAACILVSIVCSNLMLARFYRYREINSLKSTYYDIKNMIAGTGQQVIGENYGGESDINKKPDTPVPSTGDSESDAAVGQDNYDGYASRAIAFFEIKNSLDRISSEDNLRIGIIGYVDGKIVEAYNSAGVDESERILETTQSYIENGRDKTAVTSKVVYKSEDGDYTIFLTQDTYSGLYYYDLVGSLSEKTYVILRFNYQSAQESAIVANNFYAYIGIVVVIWSAIVIFIILGRFTRPIEKMTAVAKRMSNMDFDVKADVVGDNEIGQLAESLNTLSTSLEQKIIELKKANEELEFDLKKRVEIDEMRTEFLGNVSHELKTPIAIIQGYAEGLKMNVNEDPESRDFYCDVIMDEAVKMNSMVQKLLSLNKLEYGESQLDMVRFDLVELVSGVLSASEVLAGDKDVKVIFDEKEPVYVYGDEFLIEECISNFVSNAYHHVDGENIIRVSLEKKECNVRLTVFNTGENIPEEALDKVWVKFYKVDKARTREYGGSGIGLSIVKAIMEQHNRPCGVNNREDGVEFWLELDCKTE
ncbi:MAG: HAMP domain-containing histidine kinase [Lachnospiraceae bacterium]|nr:HAMP domain-containing histidine kinase [Lachnospiraceae bacterium]